MSHVVLVELELVETLVSRNDDPVSYVRYHSYDSIRSSLVTGPKCFSVLDSG